jgi:hypothetical protein
VGQHPADDPICFSPLYGAFFVKELARAAHLFPSSVS